MPTTSMRAFRQRAYALYEEHGREDDRALEDWLEAERQVLTQG